MIHFRKSDRFTRRVRDSYVVFPQKLLLNYVVKFKVCILIIKPKRCTISQFYFGKELYMFRTDLLSIIRSLNTVFTEICICHASYVDSL
jgi:hypothetical protein